MPNETHELTFDFEAVAEKERLCKLERLAEDSEAARLLISRELGNTVDEDED